MSGMRKGGDLLTHLGVPLFFGAPKLRWLIPWADKIKSSFLHSFQVYRWPSSLLKDLNAAIRNYFWTGSIDGRKSIQVALKSCCRPKDGGGLGVKDLSILNKAMLKKFTLRMLTEESLVFTYLLARFFTQDHKPRTWSVASFVWPGLKFHYTPLMIEFRWLVGHHSKVHFWSDNRLGYPLIDLVEDRSSLQPPLDSVVGEIYSDAAGWNIPTSFKASYQDVACEIENVVISTDPHSLVWTCSLDGSVSCKSTHTSFSEIPTNIVLRARGYIFPSRCQFCYAVEEDLRHFFLNCPFVRGLWNAVSSTFGHKLKLNGVFRTCRGFVKGCFATPLGVCFAFEAELAVAVYAIDYA
ncbi:hypothetical protein Ddye_004940 [Dipteronia dyeriana]|uniref:Reverse transcriptase zinc-binding domain-containing protein n=1 Tax=Dipteronia dyeriana TaxID=168575 RepID=A0AAE0CP83_9ROSI|nr:hypothetical protein Ddye_004940 [Dipteronia dyeriana]